VNKIVIGTDNFDNNINPSGFSGFSSKNAWREKRSIQHKLLKRLQETRKQLSELKVKPYYATKIEISIKGSKNLDIDKPGTKVRYSVVITLVDHQLHTKRKIFTYDAQEKKLIALGNKPIKGIIDNYDSIIKSIQEIMDKQAPS